MHGHLKFKMFILIFLFLLRIPEVIMTDILCNTFHKENFYFVLKIELL